MVETLKDYAIKALVNTVDHLGSVTYKVNDLLDEKVDEVSGTEFRVSCIEQVCLDFPLYGKTLVSLSFVVIEILEKGNSIYGLNTLWKWLRQCLVNLLQIPR